MPFSLQFTEEANSQLNNLENDISLKRILKAVRKALGYLQSDPKHKSLNTHKYSSLCGPNGETIFEAYAQNHTPGAYRIFWCYGPNSNEITIVSITPHP